MSERTPLPGKFVWFELVSRDARKAQAFYGEVLGWRVEPFAMGDAGGYDMIYVGDSMIGGYTEPTGEREPAHWISCLSVEDVDAAARAAAAGGGRVLEAPVDLPGVGRRARIADPQGAELYLFKHDAGDPPDGPLAGPGGWCWNELHTTDPLAAVEFYGKVAGFSHRALDMGADGQYHMLSRGGVDRAGVTHFLAPGEPPHWLPYVDVRDADATIARARRLGAKIPMGPVDIPGIGRFGVLEDPTGARLAVIHPLPPVTAAVGAP